MSCSARTVGVTRALHALSSVVLEESIAERNEAKVFSLNW
jgi:hypothetical protein